LVFVNKLLKLVN